MSYDIYIGNDIDKLSDFVRLFSSEEKEIFELFSLIDKHNIASPLLKEIKENKEGINLYKEEIKSLQKEINLLLEIDFLKDNILLKALHNAAEEAIEKNKQLIVIG